MTIQPNKNIASLHRFVETASIHAIRTLCSSVSELSEQAWATSTLANITAEADAQSCAQVRHEVLEGCRSLSAELRSRLEGDARRILALSEGKGPAAIRVADRDLFKFDDAEGALRSGFDGQADDLGRATFLLVQAPGLFEEAERFLHAEHYRNFGRLYAAFEVDCDGDTAFEWNDVNRSAFEDKIRNQLQLSAPCLIQHFPIEQVDDEGVARVLHMFLIRHAGLASSVQHTLPDLSLQPIHYKPPGRSHAAVPTGRQTDRGLRAGGIRASSDCGCFRRSRDGSRPVRQADVAPAVQPGALLPVASFIACTG